MTAPHIKTGIHPPETKLAAYISNSLPRREMTIMEAHIASCDECLEQAVAAYDAVASFEAERPPKNKKKGAIMKKINPYLILAIAAFVLSFAAPRYFIQFLVATLVLGIKWVVDSKSARMLVMIYEAWKSGGEAEASKVFERLEAGRKTRF